MIIKNRFFFVLLALVLSLTVVLGCSDDDDPVDPGDGAGGDDTGLDHVGSITGVVFQAGGNPLSGATITTGDQTTTTNEDGYFVLAAVPEGSTLVGFANDGFMSTFRVAEVTASTAIHYPEIVLLAVEEGIVDGAAGGEITTGDGAGSVDFEANSFVSGSGAPYTGDVTVQLNAMTTDDPDFYGTFPGEFAGVREDGSEVALVSYGFMTVELLGEDKSPLMLADGSTAELNLTLNPDKMANAPATIPMWYFDEVEGQWYEEGAAVLNGNTYTADVEHFTTWNWDVPVTDICSITGFVVDAMDNPVADVRVLSQGVGSAIMAEAFSGADGSFTVNALKNATTDIWAASGSRVSLAARVNVLEECPVVLTESLVLEVPAYSISLTWGETPSDLDTHWYIPATWDDNSDYYHIYYSNQGNMADNPYAGLDTDDTSSYGPEIVTGTRFYNGTFEYWVFDYSSNSSTNLHNSEASVQLQVQGGLWQYNVSDVTLEGANQSGWWHVFDMEVSGNGSDVTVTSVMEFQPQFSGSALLEGDKALVKK